MCQKNIFTPAHQKYYKDLLKSLDLPDIHIHQLRNTYATILLKNSFNSKGVSHLFEEVIPKEWKDQYYDYSEVIEIDLILEEYFNAA